MLTRWQDWPWEWIITGFALVAVTLLWLTSWLL